MPNINDIAGFFTESETPEPVSESTGDTEEVLEPQEAESFELEQEADGNDEVIDEGESEEPDYYSVKIDGEDYQVTLEEALAGYQRDSDYRKKTMKAAEDRKQIEARSAEIDAKLNELDSFIKREEDGTDWDELRRSDPGEYLERKEKLELAKKAAETAAQTRSKEIEAQRSEIVKSEISKLTEAMGVEWTEDRRKADIDGASKIMADFGITDVEISNTYDSRLWRMAIKLAKYEEGEKSKAKVKEAVRKAPKSVKPAQRLQKGERQHNDSLKMITDGKTRKARLAGLANLLGE